MAAGVSMAAQAAPVTFNFDDLGTSAGSAGTPVGTEYAQQGLTFSSNARAFHNGMPNGNLNGVPCRPVRDCTSPAAKPNGFVSNANGGSFTITVAADKSYTGLLLDYAVASKGFVVTVFSRPDANNGVQSVVRSISGTTGGWSDWTSGLDALSSTSTGKGVGSLMATGFGDIDHIDFTASLASFAIDNLVFTDSGTSGGGGTLPEPASFSLVALALAASGLVARRRQR